MKKNVILLAVLTGLLFVAYQTEELGKAWFENDNQQSIQLKSDISNITKVKFQDFSLNFQGPSYVVGDEQIPGDQTKLDQFLHYLGFIKVFRELKGKDLKPENYGLRHKIEFEFDEIKKVYTLGDKVSFNENFYMHYQEYKSETLVKDIYAIAKNTAPRFEAYDPDLQNDSALYNQALGVFTLDKQFFTNKTVLGEVGFIEKIMVTNKRNRPFSVSLKNYQTNPAVLEGIDPDQKAMESFAGKIKKLTAKAVYKGDRDQLSNKVSTIMLLGLTEIKLELFKSYKKQEGYFVFYKDFIYELSPVTASLFFSNVQDFWLRKPFGKGIQSPEILSGNISQGKESIDFNVPPGETFKISAKGGVNLENIQKIFLMLFGAGPTQAANRVAKTSSFLIEQLKGKKKLEFEFAKRKLEIFDLDDEVVVRDVQREVLFYYLKEPSWIFPFDIKEYLQ